MINADIDEIMTQIQEFASSWSLVGGRFDDGSMLEVADDAKANIRKLIIAASLAPANATAIVQAALEAAATAIENTNGKEYKFGGHTYDDVPATLDSAAENVRSINPQTILDSMTKGKE